MTSATSTADPTLSARVPVGAAFRHTATLTKRSLLKIKSDPEEVLGFTIQPIMFVLLFVYVFGGAFGGALGGGSESNTQAYLQYVLPGIVVQTVVFATMGTGLGLNTDIDTGIFDRFRAMPIARWAPLAAQITGDVIRYALSAVVLLIVGTIMGFQIETGIVQALAALALALAFGFALCWISCLVGLLVKTAQGIQMFAMTLMFPLTFASTVFVPAETMPGWLQGWVEVNPVSLLADAIRGLLLGGSTWGSVWSNVIGVLIWGVAIMAVFAPLSVWAYRRRV